MLINKTVVCGLATVSWIKDAPYKTAQRPQWAVTSVVTLALQWSGVVISGGCGWPGFASLVTGVWRPLSNLCLQIWRDRPWSIYSRQRLQGQGKPPVLFMTFRLSAHGLALVYWTGFIVHIQSNVIQYWSNMWQRGDLAEMKMESNRTDSRGRGARGETDAATSQSNRMTSDNHFRTLDLCAGSFSIAAVIQFYDFWKLDRRGVGVLAAPVIRRTTDVYCRSMQKSTETQHYRQVRFERSEGNGSRIGKSGGFRGIRFFLTSAESIINSSYDDKIVLRVSENVSIILFGYCDKANPRGHWNASLCLAGCIT